MDGPSVSFLHFVIECKMILNVRVWLLLVDRNLPPGVDFGKMLLKPGDDISIAFI